ncbi:MAG: uroporphyrinogen-III synthase [Candidatus Acidiferrum sp.]
MADNTPSPLAGKTVVVTRAAEQSAKLVEELSAREAKVKLLPLISFAPPENYAELDAALKRMDAFDWIIFTSANAVQAVERRRKELGGEVDATAKQPNAAAVGPATAAEAEHAGFSVEYVAEIHSGAGLAGELREELKGKNVLLPRSDRANADLPAQLRRSGATVTEVVAYRTIAPDRGTRNRVNDCLNEGVDGILFFSPSAVHSFLEMIGPKRLEAMQGRAVMVAIGPATAGALSAAGVQRIAWAADTTPAAAIEALEGHLARSRKRTGNGVNRG